MSTAIAVAGLGALAGLAWVGVLAAERSSRDEAETGSRRAAAASAVAIQQFLSTGGEAGDAVTLLESVGDLRLVLRDGDGRVVAGSARNERLGPIVAVPGRDLAVAVAVPATVGLGLEAHAGQLAVVFSIVLVAALIALVHVLRDHRRSAAALLDANRRFRDVVAADELTGLGNQARLVDDVSGLLARGTRYGNGFAIVTFDVDGVDVDETKVRAMGDVVRGQARGADRCYRLGARLVSLLPEQGLGGASIAAERVRAAAEDSRLGTLSVGVAAYLPWEDHWPEDVIGRSGIMAQQSARDGGNRVTVAETTSDHIASDHGASGHSSQS